MKNEKHTEEESSHSSCGHDDNESRLPRTLLVSLSGAFLTIALILGWLKLGPESLQADMGARFQCSRLLCWLKLSSESLQTGLYVLSSLAGGSLILPAAFSSLRRGRFDMNVLMVVAVSGAWLINEGAEGAAVVFLFALSELLESWSAGRARRAIASLLDLAPPVALVYGSTGKVVETPVAEVKVGALVQVKSGARIPLDGKITEGESSVNQAPITGESVPVDKKPEDPVYAGTINGEGTLKVEVTKAAADSTLSRIIKLVEEAEEQKAPTQRFVDKFARIYTPVVLVVAIAVALLPPLVGGQPWFAWAYKALVLLVIACPCALVIATPVSIVSGLTALARRGVLIKGGAYLEAVGKLRALAVDKTGTITQGKPQVTGVIVTSSIDEVEILRRAAAIDLHSTHPLAQAVVEAAIARGVEPKPADNYRSLTGRGASAVIDGHPHFIGNHKLAHEQGVCSPEIEKHLAEIEGKGQSLAVLGHTPHSGCAGEVLGILSIGDAIRPEAKEALQLLHKAGLRKIVMLSGDNQRTADAIASQAGIDEAIGDLLPDQKIEHIKRLMKEHQFVGMIGDGVNDAPALALASVGIAMGTIGSDTAIETADMALMKDDLTKVAEAIVLGRRTLAIIRFNVAFALSIKALFLVLAFTGNTSLWMAILADTGATLLVILNALRLLGGLGNGGKNLG